MKKIIFLYHTSTIGGGSFCLLNILKSLDRNNVEPYVLLCNDGPLVHEIKSLGVNVCFLPKMHVVPYNTSTFTIKKIKNAIEIIRSMNDLKDIIKNINPEIVYCNTMMLYPYLRPAKECGCKTIIHIREHWPENEHKWQRNMALSHIAKFADEIVAINRYSASMIEPYGRQASIVYDWIDMSSRYEEMSLERIFSEDMNDKKTFLFMGGMQSIKGVKQVLQAFTQHFLNENYRLLILGLDVNYKTKGFRGKVKGLLSFMGIKSFSEQIIELAKSDKRIKCIPSVYNIRHLYEQVYCILSYFTIPHANLALAESIICNTVNVAALTDESLEYSLEGELAILFEENNYDDFLLKLRNIESLYDECVQKMRDKSFEIENKFNPERNINVLNHVIEKVSIL